MNINWFSPIKERFLGGKRTAHCDKGKKKRPTVRPLLEMLEDRLAPAVTANLDGGSLTVLLTADNDAAFLRVNGGNIEVDDESTFTNPEQFSAATVNQVSVADPAATFTGQSVGFVAGSSPFDDALSVFSIETVNLGADFNMAAGRHMDLADNETINASAIFSASGNGAISWQANRNINVAAGSSISVENGNMTLNANQGSTAATGNFTGIDVDAAAITSIGTGKIQLTGRGGDTSFGNDGVRIGNGSVLSSTAAGGGAITIGGTGGAGIGQNNGIHFKDADTKVTSIDGAISLTGKGDGGTGADNYGIYIDSGSRVESTGTGAGAATISINGRGGDTPSYNFGVYLAADSKVSAVDGDIDITGQAGNGTSFLNIGVVFSAGAEVQSKGSGASAATITIVGTGGTGTLRNVGVHLAGTDTKVTSKDGAISITGTAGNGTSSDNVGVEMRQGAQIESTGDGAGAATITIDGTGGDGTDRNYGVYLNGSDTTVVSQEGDIHVTGKGGNGSVPDAEEDETNSDNIGVYMTSRAEVQSTGSGAGAADITITGAGGTGDTNSTGAYFGTNSKVSTGYGDIQITGAGGGTSTSNYNAGVVIDDGGSVRSTGSGADAGTITIDGTGGNGTNNNRGFLLRLEDSAVTSHDGAITIRGQGGNGSSIHNDGVVISSVAVVISIDAPVNIIGTGGSGSHLNHGFLIEGTYTIVRSTTGDINITGAGGNGTHFNNNGVQVQTGAEVKSIGTEANAATITIAGTGGGGAHSNYGVHLRLTDSKISSQVGAIQITGAGGGSAHSNYGVYVESGGQIESTGPGEAAANIDITGTGGNGTSNNYGVYIVDTDSKVTTKSGDIAITATGRGTGADNDGFVLFAQGGVEVTGEATSIDITGSSSAGVGIHIVKGSLFAPVARSVTLTADTMEIRDPHDFWVDSRLVIQPKTAGTTIGLGADAQGELNLTDAELWGLSAYSYYFGNSDAGAVDVSNVALGNSSVHVTGASISVIGLDAEYAALNAVGGIIHEGAPGTAVVAETTNLNGNVAPGQSPGQLVLESDVEFTSSSTFQVELLNNFTAGNTYDQLRVEGDNRTVNLANAALEVTLLAGYSGRIGDPFIIIDNVANDSTIDGAFNGLSEGDTITVGNHIFVISYSGGADDNDVVLTQAFPIGDQTMLNTKEKLEISLPSLGGTYSVDSAGSKAYFLDRDLNLELHPTGAWENAMKLGEKWLVGSEHQFGNEWYYITPDGRLFAWVSGTSGSLLETIDSVYHHTLDLLYDATAEHLAYVLDQGLNLKLDAGGDYEDYLGLGEKWLKGDKNKLGNRWYYITPDGNFYAYHNTTPAQLAEMDVGYHTELHRLYDAQPNQVSIAVTGNELTLDPVVGFVGHMYVELTHTNGAALTDLFQLNVIAPVVESLPSFAVPASQKEQIVSPSGTDSGGDTPIDSDQSRHIGYVLKQKYGLAPEAMGNDYFNVFNAREKWLAGAVNAHGNTWYFIKPTGDLIAWDGANQATGTVLATLDYVFYEKPELLHSANAQDLTTALGQAYGLFVDGSLHFNAFGRNENWLRGADKFWYFVLESGDLFRWDGTAGQATGRFLAKFDLAGVHALA